MLPALKLPLPSIITLQPPADEAETFLLRSIEWTTFLESTYDVALEQTTVILRYFLGGGTLHYFSRLLMPNDCFRCRTGACCSVSASAPFVWIIGDFRARGSSNWVSPLPTVLRDMGDDFSCGGVSGWRKHYCCSWWHERGKSCMACGVSSMLVFSMILCAFMMKYVGRDWTSSWANYEAPHYWVANSWCWYYRTYVCFRLPMAQDNDKHPPLQSIEGSVNLSEYDKFSFLSSSSASIIFYTPQGNGSQSTFLPCLLPTILFSMSFLPFWCNPAISNGYWKLWILLQILGTSYMKTLWMKVDETYLNTLV